MAPYPLDGILRGDCCSHWRVGGKLGATGEQRNLKASSPCWRSITGNVINKEFLSPLRHPACTPCGRHFQYSNPLAHPCTQLLYNVCDNPRILKYTSFACRYDGMSHNGGRLLGLIVCWLDGTSSAHWLARILY